MEQNAKMNTSERIAESELIINSDGSVFHLHIKPGQLADNGLLVGDPGRVKLITSRFDKIYSEAQNREFVSATGVYKNKDISVVSTGIGTDNIDIVMTELDALVNVDFETRLPREQHRTLNLVRIGTSGSLQKDLPVDSWLLSEAAIGFDGLLNFYAGRHEVCDLPFENAFKQHTDWNKKLTQPYVVNASAKLVDKLKNSERIQLGTTISAPGFYGPQGRVVRLGLADPDINSKITSFRFGSRRVTNYEMECSAIYGLSLLLGHNAATVCAIIANRLAGTATKDYRPTIEALIDHVLNSI